jgi:fatty-acid peroxygenase
VTLAVLNEALRILVEEVDYEVPAQDLSVSHRRIPTAPASGMVLRVHGMPKADPDG